MQPLLWAWTSLLKEPLHGKKTTELFDHGGGSAVLFSSATREIVSLPVQKDRGVGVVLPRGPRGDLVRGRGRRALLRGLGPELAQPQGLQARRHRLRGDSIRGEVGAGRLFELA